MLVGMDVILPLVQHLYALICQFKASMGKIRCEQADFAEFAALPTNDRQFVIPNMFSIES